MVVLFGCVTLGACGSSSLTGGSTGTGGTVGGSSSPGTVTFVLTTPAGTSFCDQITCGGGNPHLSILTTDGTALNWQGGGSCTPDCDSCQPVACPEIAIFCPASQGVAYTGGTMTWDGSVTTMSTCGAAHGACARSGFEHPGQYVAKFCATLGTVSQPDAGLPVCNGNNVEQCIQTTFDFPAAGTVQLALTTPLPQSP